MVDFRENVIANRIAQGEGAAPDESDPLSMLDQGVDMVVAGLSVISEVLPQIKPENAKEKKALKEMQDLADTGVGPYFADFVKALEKGFGKSE